MHKNDAQDATAGGEFTDGEPGITPASVFAAKWHNSVQREIIKPIVESGQTLDDEDDEQLYKAILAIVREDSVANPIGKLLLLDEYKEPAADFPYYCLQKVSEVLTTTNYHADYINYLRNKPLRYMAGTGSAKTAFDISAWERTSNVVTVTFTNTTAEQKILNALSEDNLVHGSFTNWLTITVSGWTGVTAGTYAITAINASARTISFTLSGADTSSTGVTATSTFYKHRLNAGTDPTGIMARHFQLVGNGFMTANDSNSEYIAGLRFRDRMQGFSVGVKSDATTVTGGATGIQFLDPTDPTPETAYASLLTDGSNGTPRFGATTRGAGYSVYTYHYVRRYTP